VGRLAGCSTNDPGWSYLVAGTQMDIEPIIGHTEEFIVVAV
jgi:hypothetical protein